MRDPNFKSIALNKAAVSITTNLYDRRALDSTSDRPLVNSLNHLTFLTSSSAKVRETLATDGGLERLVSILHECKKPNPYHHKSGPKTIAEEKNDAIIAWKWTLAFQCLVLIGTRGTEKIRKRVVEAGIIPIISTVLDNYLLIVRNFDNNIDNNLSENFLNLVNNQLKQNLKDDEEIDEDDDMEIKSYLASNEELSNYLNNHPHHSESHDTNNNNNNNNNNDNNERPTDYMLRNISEMNIHSNLQDINKTITSPRFFLNGILIPKEDDVVWSLQLLAFISKYANLKDYLQFTHLVDPLSLRSLLNSSNTNNNSIPPPLESDDLDNEMEYELISNLSSDENDSNQRRHNQQQSQDLSSTQATIDDSSSQAQPSTQPQTQPDTQRPSSQSSTSQILIQNSNGSNDNMNDDNPDEILTASESSKPDLSNLNGLYLQKPDSLVENDLIKNLSNDKFHSNQKKSACSTKSLLNSILKYEQCCLNHGGISETKSNSSQSQSNEEKTLNLIELTIKLDKFFQRKSSLAKLKRIKQNIIKRESYQLKWNYQSYFSMENNNNGICALSDFDKSNIITQNVNIFPLVEKFTIKSINSVDMCYWSGVIMRNSCRKDESRGGVRQCACFDCGKWENFPRQFAKCRRCKRTKYCSKECQLKAWVYHKHWCVDSNSSSSTTNSQTNSRRQIDGQNETTQLPENISNI